MNRLIHLCLVVGTPLLLACSSGQSNTRASKTPPPRPWTGDWIKLDGLAVPPDKKMRLVETCTGRGEYWSIEQKGTTITLELHDGTQNNGINMAVERVKIEKARGPLHKSFARLEGEFGTAEVGGAAPAEKQPRGRRFPVTYELQWEPKTEHLAGTRNGSPVRFIRAELQAVDRNQCPPAR